MTGYCFTSITILKSSLVLHLPVSRVRHNIEVTDWKNLVMVFGQSVDVRIYMVPLILSL
jgi:hypothetical protein